MLPDPLVEVGKELPMAGAASAMVDVEVRDVSTAAASRTDVRTFGAFSCTRQADLGYFFDAHFDSSATMFADNPKVENLTTSDGFLIID
jgi:hypothetical protein